MLNRLDFLCMRFNLEPRLFNDCLPKLSFKCGSQFFAFLGSTATSLIVWSLPSLLLEYPGDAITGKQGKKFWRGSADREKQSCWASAFHFTNSPYCKLKCYIESMISGNTWNPYSMATFTRDGYVKIRLGSDPLWYGSTLLTPDRFETGTVRYGITFISGPIWYQIADPIRTRFTRFRANARLIRSNFVPVSNRSGPV